MSDDDQLKQEDIDALLGGAEEPAAKPKGKGSRGGKGKKAEEPAAEAGGAAGGGMSQSEIDALLGGGAPAPTTEGDGGGQLDQSDIDAMMGEAGQAAPPVDAGMPDVVAEDLSAEAESLAGSEAAPVSEASLTAADAAALRSASAAAAGAIPEVDGEEEPIVDDLTEQEKDALGEIGNICMGSASTTLSMLLNHKVSITSPTVLTTTLKRLVAQFDSPYMTIYIKYIDGLSGFNLLIMRLDDAAVLADLMMGGEGQVVSSEELTEMGISAASEAMNQMIGSSSTSMASMFGRVVNISPPETYVSQQIEDMNRLQDMIKDLVVVASFNMTVGNVLDTKIMQVMDIDTARETASLILKDMYEEAAEAPAATGMDDLAAIEQALEPPPPKAAPAAAAAPQPAARPVAASSHFRPDVDSDRLEMLLDIPLKATALLGRTKWSIKDVLGIVPGSVVELDSLVDEPVEILVNGILVAMGEVVVVNENFGVRITSIIEPAERLRRLMERKFSV